MIEGKIMSPIDLSTVLDFSAPEPEASDVKSEEKTLDSTAETSAAATFTTEPIPVAPSVEFSVPSSSVTVQREPRARNPEASSEPVYAVNPDSLVDVPNGMILGCMVGSIMSTCPN